MSFVLHATQPFDAVTRIVERDGPTLAKCLMVYTGMRQELKDKADKHQKYGDIDKACLAMERKLAEYETDALSRRSILIATRKHIILLCHTSLLTNGMFAVLNPFFRKDGMAQMFGQSVADRAVVAAREEYDLRTSASPIASTPQVPKPAQVSARTGAFSFSLRKVSSGAPPQEDMLEKYLSNICMDDNFCLSESNPLLWWKVRLKAHARAYSR